VLDSDDARGVAVALIDRLRGRGITGWRSIGFVGRFGDEEFVLEVGLWPMDPDVMEEIVSVAAPVQITFKPCPGAPPRGRR
jgi:hypothetical protein